MGDMQDSAAGGGPGGRPPEVVALAAFMLASAVVLVIAVLFPMSDRAPIGLGIAMTPVALGLAIATFFLGPRLPRWVLLAEAVLAAVLNSVLVAAAATPAGAIADALAYAALMLYVAAFFPPAVPLFGLVVAAGFGAGLLAGGLPRMLAPWALITVTTCTLGLVVGRISVVIRRALMTDALTGALNRSGMRQAAMLAERRIRKQSADITVAALDLDGFKEINDRDGHAEGDRVLAEAASAWRGAIRDEDVLARVGGDEFILIMPGTSPDEAGRVLDRLRAAHQLAWSAGVALWRPGDSLEVTLERADQRLYAAKRSGRAAVALDRSGAGESGARQRDRAGSHGRSVVPRGRALTAEEWRTGHQAAVRIAVTALLVATAYGLARGPDWTAMAGYAGSGAALLAIGTVQRLGRNVRASAVALTLMLVAALTVQAADGAVEAHFLFFLAVPVIALHASWAPLGVAVAFVVCHQLVSDPVGEMEAWEGAIVHGALMLAACGAALLEWHVSESRSVRLRDEIVHRSAEARRARTDLDVAQADTVRRLSMAVEFRDDENGAHTDRIGRYSGRLAEAAGVPRHLAELIGVAAPLHDVGKVAVPDAVLCKRGPLDAAERALVETHAEVGHRLLAGSSSRVLEVAASIAWTHHERWDGTGYPRGLAGEDIPIEGRIVAIVDVFDALTHDRVYRPALSLEEALGVMRDGRGTHFDPELLDIFLESVAVPSPAASG